MVCSFAYSLYTAINNSVPYVFASCMGSNVLLELGLGLKILVKIYFCVWAITVDFCWSWSSHVCVCLSLFLLTNCQWQRTWLVFDYRGNGGITGWIELSWFIGWVRSNPYLWFYQASTLSIPFWLFSMPIWQNFTLQILCFGNVECLIIPQVMSVKNNARRLVRFSQSSPPKLIFGVELRPIHL